MGYIKMTFQYLWKNFWYLLPLVLLPAIAVGVFTEPFTMLQFYANFDINAASFTEIFFGQSDLSLLTALLGLALVPLGALSISALCGVISRDMRYGKMGLDNLNRRINFNFLPVLKTALAFLIVTQLYAIICSSLTLLWMTVCDSEVVALSLTVVINSLLAVLAFVGMMFLILVIPAMTINGLNFRKACAESVHAMKGKFFKVRFSLILPMLVPFVIMGLLSYYGFWWRKIINPILFIFIFMYLIVYIFVLFFDVEDIDREDIKDKFVE